MPLKTSEFLSLLQDSRVNVWLEGDELRYSGPGGVLPDSLRGEIEWREEEIRAVLIEARVATQTAHPEIPAALRPQTLPLSFAQERLWLLDQFLGETAVYGVPWAFRVTGPLKVDAFEESLKEIVRRHEILRTTFASDDGRPSQVIAPSSTFELLKVDLQRLPASKREDTALQLAAEDAQQPFDLTRGPLFRATLLRLEESDYFALFAMHHIISDAWSLEVFNSELSALYEAFCQGESSPLPELPIQYADFAVWQRKWLRGEVLDGQLSYWRHRLAEAPSALELPTDRPRPAVQTFRGSLEPIELSDSLSEALEALSRQEEATLFMVLLGAFQVLLHRYSGQDDIVVGSPIANRNRPEIENLIGFFVNTLAMRTDLSGDPTFRELLVRVREGSLEAYTHQDLPFERLVEEVQPERDLSRNPLFQVMFAFHNTPMSVPGLSGVALSPLGIHSKTSKFDLSLHLWGEPDGLRGFLEYNTDLLEASTVTRMAEHFRILLKSVCEDPDQKLSALPLLTEEEQNQLLVEWNDTGVDHPSNQCIHQLFEKQVERTPDAVAVVYEDSQLSYGELNRRANQLAHYLMDLGVGPEVLVGMCMDRSLEMVVGILGILKAGGAYVPLDPEYPKDRLAFMVDDTQASVLLTQRHLLDRLPQRRARTVLLDEDMSDRIAQQEELNPRNQATLDNLAYVIYTSGSTGKPKGTMIPHAGIRNRLLWMQDAFPLSQSDRILQKTPFSFDVSVWEFLWGIVSGACLVVSVPRGHRDPSYLVDTVVSRQITVVHFVPSMLSAFLDEMQRLNCPSLRWVFCSGEILPTDLQAHFHSLMDSDLNNLYGPTEASVDVTFFPSRRGSQYSTVPIGRPIWNTQIYILDPQWQPLPASLTGELYIGGVNLARGYLSRPDLTAESFVPNPYSREPGTRMYRSGDLASWLPDGNLEFAGRTDHQVKIRGHRVELGEIEAELRKHPHVRESIVLCEERQTGRSLVAYVVPEMGQVDLAALSSPNRWQSECLDEWREVFDETYKQVSHGSSDLAFNLAGWNSSVSGRQIDAEEMREWVGHTVGRILSLKPRRVLEIGCGSGLLLLRIAPYCERYWGTDFSHEALSVLNRQLKQPGCELPQVELLERNADDFTGLGSENIDTVILNSVVQYFPDVDYLLRVLGGAIEAMGPVGSIFIGDVRNLSLLEAQHLFTHLAQCPSSLSAGQLKRRVWSTMEREEELAIHPALFYAIGQQTSCISSVSLELKRGRSHNELTKFRYDVTFHVGASPPKAANGISLDWHEHKLSAKGVCDILRGGQCETLLITGIPNARLSTEVEAGRLVASFDESRAVGELLGELKESLNEDTVDPEDLYTLGYSSGYHTEIGWNMTKNDGSYDVLFRLPQASSDFSGLYERSEARSRHWVEYTNDPARRGVASTRSLELNDFLRRSVPPHMVPSAFVFLESLPLTSSGKVDRTLLPSREHSQPARTNDYVEPRTVIEQAVSQIWSEALGVERVGVRDNFFLLGGHSLIAVQIASRLRTVLSRDVPLSLLFEAQTIEELANRLEDLHHGP